MILDHTKEQEACKASVNTEIIRPTNKTPSPVDNIVVVEDVSNKDDMEVPTDEDDIEVQECK